MPPKKKAAKQSSTATASPSITDTPAAALVPSNTTSTQVVLAFIRAIVSRPKLSTILDPNRIKSFETLLSQIDDPNTHTKLLLLAHPANDADAIHVLLRANKFLTDAFDIGHCVKFLLKPLYTVNNSDDKTSKTIYKKLLTVFNDALSTAETNGTLTVYLTSAEFDLFYLQDITLINMILRRLMRSKTFATVLSAHRQQFLQYACQQQSSTLLKLCFDYQTIPELNDVAIVATHSPLAYYAMYPSANLSDIKHHLLMQWNPADLTDSHDVCALELLVLCCHLNTPELDAIKTFLKTRLAGKNLKPLFDQFLMSELAVIALTHADDIQIALDRMQIQAVISKTLSATLFNMAVKIFGEKFYGIPYLAQVIENFLAALSTATDKKHLYQEYNDFFQSTLPYLHHYKKLLDSEKKPEQEKVRQQLEILLTSILILFIQTDYLRGIEDLQAQFPNSAQPYLTAPIPDNSKLNRFGFTGFSLLKIALHSQAKAVSVYLFEHMQPEHISDITCFASQLFDNLVNTTPPRLDLIVKCLTHVRDIFCSFLNFRTLINIVVLQPAGQDPALVASCLNLLRPYASLYFRNPLFNFYLTEKFSHDQLDDLARCFSSLENSNHTLLKASVYERHAATPLEGVNPQTQLAIRSNTLLATAVRSMVAVRDTAAEKQALETLTDTAIRRMLSLNNTHPEILRNELVAVSALPQNYINYARRTMLEQGENHDPLTFFYFYDLAVLVELALILQPNLNLYTNTVTTDIDLFELICKRHHDGLIKALLEYCYNRENKDQYALRPDLIQPKCSPKYYYHLFCGYAEIKQDKLTDGKNFCQLATHKHIRDEHYTPTTPLAKLQLITHMDWILAPNELECAATVETFIRQAHEGPYTPSSTTPSFTTSLPKLPRLAMLALAMEAKDSFLIMTALKYQHQGVVPVEHRQECIKILLLCPNRLLADKLNLRSEDILACRDYQELGYRQPLNGFSILLSELDVAINHRWVKSALRSLGLLCYFSEHVEPAYYPLLAFLLAAERLHQLATATSDKVFILDYCYSLLISGKFSLNSRSLSKQVLDFIQIVLLNCQADEDLEKLTSLDLPSSVTLTPLPATSSRINICSIEKLPNRIDVLSEQFSTLLTSPLHTLECLALTQHWQNNATPDEQATLQRIANQIGLRIKQDNINYLALLRQHSIAKPHLLASLPCLWQQLTIDTDPADIDWLLQLAILQGNTHLLNALCRYAKIRPYQFDLCHEITELADPQALTHLQRVAKFIDLHSDRKQEALKIISNLLRWGNISQLPEESVLNVLEKLMFIRVADFSRLLGSLTLSCVTIQKLIQLIPHDNIETLIALLNYHSTHYPNDRTILEEYRSAVGVLSRETASFSLSLQAIYLDTLSQQSITQLIDLFDTLTRKNLIAIKSIAGSLNKNILRILNDAIDHKTKRGNESFQVYLCNQLDIAERQINLACAHIITSLEKQEKAEMPAERAQAKTLQHELQGILLGVNNLSQKFEFLAPYFSENERQNNATLTTLSQKIKAVLTDVNRHITKLEKAQQQIKKQHAAIKKMEHERQLQVAQQCEQQKIKKLTEDLKNHLNSLEKLRSSLTECYNEENIQHVTQQLVDITQAIQAQAGSIESITRNNNPIFRNLRNTYQLVNQTITEFEELLRNINHIKQNQQNDDPLDSDDETVITSNDSDYETVKASSPAPKTSAATTAATATPQQAAAATPRYYPGMFAAQQRRPLPKPVKNTTFHRPSVANPLLQQQRKLTDRALPPIFFQRQLHRLATEKWQLEQRLLQEQSQNQQMAYYLHGLFYQQQAANHYLQTVITAQQIQAMQQAALLRKQEMLALAQHDLEKSHEQQQQIKSSRQDMGFKLSELGYINHPPFPNAEQDNPQPILPIALLKASPYYSDDRCIYLEITFNKDITESFIEICKDLGDLNQQCSLFVVDSRIKAGLCCIYFEKIIGEEGYTWTILQDGQLFSHCQVISLAPAFARLVEADKVSAPCIVPGIHDMSYWDSTAATPGPTL